MTGVYNIQHATAHANSGLRGGLPQFIKEITAIFLASARL